MYDKYTKFNLNLSCYTMRTPNVHLDEADITYFMSGFNWSNQGYSLKSGSITNKAFIFTCHLFTTTTVGSEVQINSNTITFHKPTSNS